MEKPKYAVYLTRFEVGALWALLWSRPGEKPVLTGVQEQLTELVEKFYAEERTDKPVRED